jgi:hypothetical protein
MSDRDFNLLIEKLITSGAAGARYAYWCLLNERIPASSDLPVRRLSDLASQLHARDRAFFYDEFVVLEKS